MVVEAHTGTVYLYDSRVKIERSGGLFGAGGVFSLNEKETWIDIEDLYEVPMVQAGAITTGILKFRTGEPGTLIDNRVRFTKEQERDIIELRNALKSRIRQR